MARVPFKQRSQGSSFKMMGSSPLKGGKRKQKEADARKYKSYTTTVDAVTADLTNEQLREMALSQHIDSTTGETTANKWNVSYAHLLKLRNAAKPTEKKTVEKVEVVEGTKKEEVSRYHGAGGTIVDEEGNIIANPELYDVQEKHIGVKWSERDEASSLEKISALPKKKRGFKMKRNK